MNREEARQAAGAGYEEFAPLLKLWQQETSIAVMGCQATKEQKAKKP